MRSGTGTPGASATPAGLTALRGGRNHTPVPAPNSPALQLHAKSVYGPAEPGDGRRVLVTRYWPRGVPKAAVDEYVSALAPSRELLHAFKGGEIDWEEYKTRYLQEMQNEDPKMEIRRLANAARHEIITLMCVCKDERVCHRTLLRNLILNADES